MKRGIRDRRNANKTRKQCSLRVKVPKGRKELERMGVKYWRNAYKSSTRGQEVEPAGRGRQRERAR